MLFDRDSGELLRTRPNPLTQDQAWRLQGARAAGPPHRTAPPLDDADHNDAPAPPGSSRSAGHIVSVQVAQHTLTINHQSGAPRQSQPSRKATHVL
jgi:hypothetical protein